MTTSNPANHDVSYMPELPEGFFWDVRRVGPEASPAQKVKFFVFLKRVTDDVSRDTIAWEFATAPDGDLTKDQLASIGEGMLMKTSNRAALGLVPPLA